MTGKRTLAIATTLLPEQRHSRASTSTYRSSNFSVLGAPVSFWDLLGWSER